VAERFQRVQVNSIPPPALFSGLTQDGDGFIILLLLFVSHAQHYLRLKIIRLSLQHLATLGDDAFIVAPQVKDVSQIAANRRRERIKLLRALDRGQGFFQPPLVAQIDGMALVRRRIIDLQTNSSGETLPQTRDKAMELVLSRTTPDPETAPPPPPLSEAELRGYTGIYSHAPRTWEVFMKEGKLYLRHEGAEQSLTNVGQHIFSFGARRLVFVPGADGEAQHLFMSLYAARKMQGEK
jgi:hypothetical protein